MKSSTKQHLAKTITWRLISVIITVLIAYVMTGSVEAGLLIGGVDAAVKMGLYFLHEQAWHRAHKRAKHRQKVQNLSIIKPKQQRGSNNG